LALDPKHGLHAQYHNKYGLAANAALIEAVLSLSGGRRYDCRMTERMEGWWLNSQNMGAANG
jgi:hypothetical protein